MIPPLSRSDEAMPSTPTMSMFSRRREGACDATNACTCTWKIRKLPRQNHLPQSPRHIPRQASQTLLIDTFTFQRNLTEETENRHVTQSDDPFQFDDPPVTALVILLELNSGHDRRDDLPHLIRTQLQQSRIRKPVQCLEPDAKRLRLDDGK